MSINLSKTDAAGTGIDAADPRDLKIKRLLEARDFWQRQEKYAQQCYRIANEKASLMERRWLAAEEGVSVVQGYRARLQEKLDAAQREIAFLKMQLIEARVRERNADSTVK